MLQQHNNLNANDSYVQRCVKLLKIEEEEEEEEKEEEKFE